MTSFIKDMYVSVSHDIEERDQAYKTN